MVAQALISKRFSSQNCRNWMKQKASFLTLSRVFFLLSFFFCAASRRYFSEKIRIGKINLQKENWAVFSPISYSVCRRSTFSDTLWQYFTFSRSEFSPFNLRESIISISRMSACIRVCGFSERSKKKTYSSRRTTISRKLLKWFFRINLRRQKKNWKVFPRTTFPIFSFFVSATLRLTFRVLT